MTVVQWWLDDGPLPNEADCVVFNADKNVREWAWGVWQSKLQRDSNNDIWPLYTTVSSDAPQRIVVLPPVLGVIEKLDDDDDKPVLPPPYVLDFGRGRGGWWSKIRATWRGVTMRWGMAA